MPVLSTGIVVRKCNMKCADAGSMNDATNRTATKLAAYKQNHSKEQHHREQEQATSEHQPKAQR